MIFMAFFFRPCSSMNLLISFNQTKKKLCPNFSIWNTICKTIVNDRKNRPLVFFSISLSNQMSTDKFEKLDFEKFEQSHHY